MSAKLKTYILNAKTAGVFGGTFGVYSAYQRFLSRGEYEEIRKNLQRLENDANAKELLNKTIELSNQTTIDNSKVYHHLENCIEASNLAIKNLNKLFEKGKELTETNLPESESSIANTLIKHYREEINNSINKAISENKEANDIFNKINESISKSNFNVQNIITDVKNYISSLPFEQVVALSNLLLSFTILLSLISMMAIFYGDILINNFKIEERFPKIARFIQLRRKLQKYYFGANILLIIYCLTLMFFVNTLLFIS